MLPSKQARKKEIFFRKGRENIYFREEQACNRPIPDARCHGTHCSTKHETQFKTKQDKMSYLRTISSIWIFDGALFPADLDVMISPWMGMVTVTCSSTLPPAPSQTKTRPSTLRLSPAVWRRHWLEKIYYRWSFKHLVTCEDSDPRPGAWTSAAHTSRGEPGGTYPQSPGEGTVKSRAGPGWSSPGCYSSCPSRGWRPWPAPRACPPQSGRWRSWVASLQPGYFIYLKNIHFSSGLLDKSLWPNVTLWNLNYFLIWPRTLWGSVGTDRRQSSPSGSRDFS